MAGSSSIGTNLIPTDLFLYITSSKRGYLTRAELFHYYQRRHENAEIPYRLFGYRLLLDLLNSDQRLLHIDLSSILTGLAS